MSLQLTAIALAAMLAITGGAAAVVATGAASQASPATTAHDAHVAASLGSGTLTVTVTNGGAPVENATVAVADATARTGANGSATLNASPGDALELRVRADGFVAEQTYRVTNGSMTLLEEQYRYGPSAWAGHEDGHDHEGAASAQDDQSHDGGAAGGDQVPAGHDQRATSGSGGDQHHAQDD